MRVYQCDRCGKGESFMPTVFMNRHKKDGKWQPGFKLHLCTACLSEFVEWMKEKR